MESDMVEYRIGNRIVKVTKDDAAALRDDLILFGMIHISVDHATDTAVRLDPSRIIVKPE